jgi:phosphonopyruvate decarboxylase
VALLAGRAAFSTRRSREPRRNVYTTTREDALERVLAGLPSEAAVVSTTGRISRELDELRARGGRGASADFLMVGSMGRASQIALGIALAKPDRLVVCLDGDGAVLMHMGGLATIGSMKPPRLVHIVFNNGAHESVGGHPTAAFDIDLTAIARGCGYRVAVGPISERERIAAELEPLLHTTGPCFLELRVASGSRSDLGRPRESPSDNKTSFMERFGRG